MFDNIWNNSKHFKACTGMSLNVGQLLFTDFKSKFWQSMGLHLHGGNDFKLAPQDMLLMFLMYYRHQHTLEYLGAIFNLHHSNVDRTIKAMEPLLEDIFLDKGVAPLDTSKDRREIENLFSQLSEIYIDGTELPINRPSDPEEQKANYSGKKKDIQPPW